MILKLDGFPNRKELKGSFGEWLAKWYIKFVSDTLVLHDVLIDGADGYTSQIDLLAIGSKGIYVVEVKMYNEGRIYGDGNQSQWYYYHYNKKYEIYSPLKQNKKHIEYLKKFLKGFGDIPCFSVIVIICDDFKVKNINRPGEINTVICSSLPMTKKALQCLAEGKPVVLNKEKQQAIFDYIEQNQKKGKEVRTAHKQNVIAYQKELQEIKEQKLCPYCKAPLVLRKGKYGEFYGCSNFPECKYTSK